MEIDRLMGSVDPLEFMGDMILDVGGLCYDSRRVQPGDLFVAIKGYATDGHIFLNDAGEKGARGFVIEDRRYWEDPAVRKWVEQGVTLCLVSDTRRALALMADEFYGHPSRRLKLVGVTGTNGKTTTCTLIARIMEAAGERVGWITTLNYGIGGEEFPSQRTTPESLDLHRILHQMVEGGCGWGVVEVSSHSLVLQRVAGCSFDAAVLTNITQDHLDFHTTHGEYRRAKARLFEMLDRESAGSPADRCAVFNLDDPASREILEHRKRVTANPSSTVTYGIEGNADVTARDIEHRMEGVSFRMVTPWGDHHIGSSLMGRPNIYNILAASCVAMAFGVEGDDLQAGIHKVTGVPGRFERISAGQDFDVIIDYAHTDDALANLLSVVRAHARGRVICVFGCGGNRDRTKRPLMGKAAARGSDWSILTSDNPRGEEPEDIIREIEAGFVREKGKEGYEICIDRREAIHRAIHMAKPGDMVVITGKGHETTQTIGSQVLPFDDREVTREILTEFTEKRVGI
ncbi:MAG: UDP-N-acetylmuramoyl-L-alanyl-D-glutamate--2,6-diaminopimelate ligase [bacterium]